MITSGPYTFFFLLLVLVFCVYVFLSFYLTGTLFIFFVGHVYSAMMQVHIVRKIVWAFVVAYLIDGFAA